MSQTLALILFAFPIGVTIGAILLGSGQVRSLRELTRDKGLAGSILGMDFKPPRRLDPKWLDEQPRIKIFGNSRISDHGDAHTDSEESGDMAGNAIPPR